MSENVLEKPLADALSERYLAYALSTIVSRSLPDVRDGLKPVHRRLLYAMRLLRLDPLSGYKKCARVVGDVIGKFHPHGEIAVYDALVRLAQDFSVRYPLVDGQGNFGNVDGDSAAAMRYTEAKLTPFAEKLLQGIDETAVDFRKTYDNESDEPVLLPAAWPNLLANGATGIAVGMATSIPPHNLNELFLSLIALIDKPEMDLDEIMQHIQGPDFPTGGIIVENFAQIKSVYETGKGSLRVRARWEIEKQVNGLWQVVVTEIPYQVQKSKLIEKIAEIILSKKTTLLSDVRDESAEDLRIVLVPKNRNVNADVLMESLFKFCDLEVRIHVNLNALDATQTPRVHSLKEMLQAFLDHRKVVLVRSKTYRLQRIFDRMHLLEGYLIVFAHLDEVIAIIRDHDDPKNALKLRFHLSDIQVEALLNLRLRALRRLEEALIREEYQKLGVEKSEIETLLASDQLQWKFIKKELRSLQTEFAKLGKPWQRFIPRKTSIAAAPELMPLPVEAEIEKEPITVLLSEKGWVKTFKGHQELGEETTKFKEGDALHYTLKAHTTDLIIILTQLGRFYTIKASQLPGGRGHGEPIRLMVDLSVDENINHIFVYEAQQKLLLASKEGKGFIVPQAQILAQTKNGKQIFLGCDKTSQLFCQNMQGDHIAIVGENRKLLVFPITELPELNKGKGFILQRYKQGAMADIKTFFLEEGLICLANNRKYTKEQLFEYIGHRAQTGRMAPYGFPRKNKFDEA